MTSVHRRPNKWLRSFNDVTRLCLGTAAACFLVSAALTLAGCFFPVGARSAGVFAVGCFFLVHALVELLKQQWDYARWLAILGQVCIVPGSISRQRETEWDERAAA